MGKKKTKKQRGKGRTLSFAHLGRDSRHQLGKRSAAKIKMKKTPSGLKSSKKKKHTQVPIQNGFIGIRLRNRPVKRTVPPTGIVNRMPAVGERRSDVNAQPQQLSWED